MNLKVTKGTIVRTIMICIVVINLILEKCGLDVINTEQNTIAAFVEMFIEAGSIIAAWWYNNSYSTAAKKADRFFSAIKEAEAKGINK